MEELIARIPHALSQKFPGATTELERAKPLRKVGGFLIWSGFDGVEQLKRQRSLSQALKEKLTSEDLARFTTILTITPDESAVMREESSASHG